VSIETSYQNVGIATSVALSMYSNKEEEALAVGVPLYYAFVEVVVLAIFCLWAWKAGWTYAPKDANLFKVIWSTFQEKEEAGDKVEQKKGGGKTVGP